MKKAPPARKPYRGFDSAGALRLRMLQLEKKPALPPAVRFWAKVEKTEDCWNWTGCLHNGYGIFNAYTDKKTETIRSEEHTSELQSHSDLVCRLLLEKK